MKGGRKVGRIGARPRQEAMKPKRERWQPNTEAKEGREYEREAAKAWRRDRK